MENRGKAVPRGAATSPESAMASELFDHFVSASTFKSVLHTNRQLCELLRLKPTNISNFYPRLKAKLHSWRAASLWAKLDKRASHKCYNRGKACPNTRVLIIGAGPCGLRTAIEAQLLGAKVVVVEKRDRFSRNNVLHLWPFVIHDLRSLGSKKFFGKFCAGSIDHISIRQLQIILLKVALLLGVEVHVNVGFEGLIEPPEDQSQERIGWRAHVSPTDHPVSQYEFDVLIGADGKRNTLLGFNRKEFRGKLAIAVTANFINKHSPEEARVPEISGVAFIFNQKFFQDMKEQTAIDLENIVYYKDDTHYFVMTAKKQSLLERGVIIQDFADTARLLASENVDREALMEYARDAADFATSGQLPHFDFAVNHYGQADVAMFDFTSMYAAENACRVVQKRDHKLLQGLVGDSLLEPFWPTGSGCARGFLSAFDAAWMIRSWASGKLSTLQVLAERESIYRLLAQTTPENLSKDLNQYTPNPSSRYPNLNLQAVLPSQVRSLFTTDGKIEEMALDAVVEAPKKKRRRESMIHPDTLLNWCKKQVALSDRITIQDFTSSWKDGLALCTVLHHYRPDLIDLSALDPENIAKNNQLAFDICERELGIPPVMTGQEMAECTVPDKLTMVSYISQVYESFRGEIPVVSHPKLSLEERTVSPSKLGSSSPLFILNKVSSRVQGKRKYSIERELAKERERGENVKKRSSIFTHKRRSRDKAGFTGDKNQDIVLTNYKSIPINKPRESINTRVKNLEAQMKKDAGLRCHQSGEGDLARPSHARGEPTELNIKMLQQQLQSAEKVPNVKKARSPKVGKLRKDEWNVKIIEEKIKQVKSPQLKNPSPEKPKIFKEIFSNKLHAMNEVLKAGGSLTPEEAAKYREFDASLNKLKTRLTKGNLETGVKGHNQTAAMSEHMTTIWNKKDGRRRDPLPPAPVVKPHEETDSQKSAADSTVCYFCKGRVYLMQRLSAEGLFFHRTCFKCEYCGNVLRLGDFAFDKDAGGKFYCTAHFRMQKTDLRQQEMMKRKQAFLTCALEQEKEKLYQIIRDNTEKALSPGRQAGTTSPTVTDSNVPAIEKTEPPISPSNYLAEPVGTIGRDQTPERVEYENSILELSEDELLTSELEEEELTQKNLGPSQDLATSEDDYSDLSTDSESDEEAFAEELERSLTADETRKLAETWNRKYSAEQSLLYSLSSSSADDEGSDTEIGSDDTSHDIDSDAEYSIENSEEDGAQTKDSENPSASKSPEEKEFSMEVPVIDLKSMNRVSENETTSESDELIDEDGDLDEETGTEVDSESESTPPPPQQIPTIVIYESPPQNTELDQEWNENSATVKDQETVDENVNATINLSSDTSISNSKEENQDHDLLDPELNAEEDIDLDFNEDDDGKCIEVTDKDKNDDSLCSRVEAKVSDEDNLEIKASELSPTQVKAPLAIGESSSDLSVSSEIDSLAKDIVSDVIKAAESTIIEQLSPKDKIDGQIPADDSLAPQALSGIGSKVVEEEHSNIFCSTPYSKEPVVKISIPETSSIQNMDESKAYVKNTEEIDLCSPSPQNTMIVTDKESSPSNSKELAQNLFPSEKLNELDKISFDANESVVILNESFPVPQPETPLHSISREEPPKEVENLKKGITEACVDDTVVLDDSSDLPILSDESIDASRNTTSFITVRKKQNTTKNDSLDWDSDKSMSILPVFYEEEISIDDFNKKRNCVAEADKLSAPKLMAESLPNHDIKESDLVANVNLSPELSSQIDLANSCLSQSLPNSSTPFLLGPSFPKTVSCTSAEFENAKLEKLCSLKNYTPLSTSELRLKGSEESLLDEKPSKFIGKNYFSGNSKNSMSDSLDNSKQSTPSSSASKSETKYKGYSGSFAEKVRPKSLFCDAIYLRSLDIKLTKQPFSSLNKSDDNLDEHVRSDKDSVKKRLFDEAHKSPNLVSNKPVISNASTLSLGSSFTTSTDTISTSVLKTTTPTDKLTNASLNKHKNPCHKQSSVSFSTESYGDLVSPYNCNQSKPSEISFPTKVKPKCDLDITKLRQKREKRKSVHEDLQGLPFADEDKLVSPVDPLSSSEVFVPPKASNSQDKGLSTPTMEQSLPQYKTPDLIDEERYLRMQSTVEQKKAREEARARARLKSDEELGLSPNNYRKKYRRQLSLNSINYDELCSDEFCDQEDEELEDDIINNFCQTKNLGIEDTFNMFKNTDLYTDSKTADKCIISSQQHTPQPIETEALPSSSDELIASTDSLDTVESAKCQEPQQGEPSVRKTKKHSNNTSSSETSPEVCKLDSPFDSKLQASSNSKTSLTDGSAEEEKLKSNGKKSIFSILNFGKSNVSKEKTKQKSKGSGKDLSSSLPSDIGARSNPKGKPFSNLKLSISKEKGMKPKAKSVPPESVPASPLESIYATNDTPYVSLGAQQSKVIPKYTVYRNPETALSSFPEPTISTFPVHLPVPKMENGLAPKASEDSFSDEDDTQGTKAGHLPSAEKADKNEKERKAQRILQKVQRQQVLKRMRNAQEMQRRLEELEIQQKEIEVQGVQLEKILRGEHHAMNGGKGETELEQEWYTLVHTKNKLTREVQELYIRLKDIELEERQSRLQQDFTQRMADGFRKNQTQLIEERKILDEMLQIVDKRNELVKVLDQLKLREEEDEIVIGSDVFTKGMKSPLSPSEKS